MRLTQQQFQFVRLLELSAPEFDEAVERELEANPALEAIPEVVSQPESSDQNASAPREPDMPYYLYGHQRFDGDISDYEAPVVTDDGETLYDHLRRQIRERDIPERVARVAEYIVGNLDSNGYLQRPVSGIINDLAFNHGVEIDESCAREAFDVVRSLDPSGVCAENLRDCLLLQLAEKRAQNACASVADESVADALAILTDYFEAYSMRHTHKIISGLHLSAERMAAANEVITSLNPKPGSSFGGGRGDGVSVVTPDLRVYSDDGGLHVCVNTRYPELRVDDSFDQAVRSMESRRGKARKGNEYILANFDSARDFIALVGRRQEMLRNVMTAIVKLQKDYFDTGDVYHLKPMMIKDVSALTGYDLSAVSRSTNNKYVETPWGAVMPLRAFFSEDKSAEDSGETLTNRQIEAQISAIVDAEDKKHPLSDEKIRQAMLSRGYDLSRRTIAKYRDRQGILVARLRKSL